VPEKTLRYNVIGVAGMGILLTTDFQICEDMPRDSALKEGESEQLMGDRRAGENHCLMLIGLESWLRGRSYLLPACADGFSIFFQDSSLDHRPGFLVDGMSNILISAVFPFFARHRDEVAGSTLDNLNVSDHKTRINRNSNVGFKFFFFDRKNFNFCDLHSNPPDSLEKKTL
jgi:hypothetical protein